MATSDEHRVTSPWPCLSNNHWGVNAHQESRWDAAARLFEVDPHTRLCAVRIFQNQTVLGYQCVYASGGQTVELPRIYSKSGYYGYTSQERPPAVLELAPGEAITAVGAGTGEILDTLVLRTSAGREVVGGNATRGHITYFHIPRGQALAGIDAHVNGVVHRPLLITVPTFWALWGWLVIWRSRLGIASHDTRAEYDPALALAPPDASRVERLVARLVLLDEDLFRMVARELRG